MARLPEYVHAANVAGLEPKRKARDVNSMFIVPDNAPPLAWVLNRLNELEGDVAAQTTLFEALPLEMQNAIWETWQ